MVGGGSAVVFGDVVTAEPGILISGKRIASVGAARGGNGGGVVVGAGRAERHGGHGLVTQTAVRLSPPLGMGQPGTGDVIGLS
ncbi:MAG: hypothetical protein ABF290_17455 [Thiogranum sp.]